MEESRTVLAVDDERPLLELVDTILVRASYKVLAAGTAQEAVRICREQSASIDLLLLDIVMPVMGGPELVQHLRDLGIQLPVVYMSGFSDETIAHKVHGLAEMRAFLRKPFTPQELVNAVETAIREVQRKSAGSTGGGAPGHLNLRSA